MRRFLPLLAFVEATASTECDLSASGIFKVGSNGKYNWGDTWQIKRNKKNPATGEFLQNAGKVLKGKALIRQVKDGDFCDAWVVCKSNKMMAYKIECNSEQYTINGKSGEDIELPDCSPMGCDKATLPFPGTNNKCRMGSYDGESSHLEKSGNRCERSCTTSDGKTFKTKKMIACKCDHTTRECSYQIYDKPTKTWYSWDAEKPNGKGLFIGDWTPETCEGGDSTPKPPTPEPTDPPATAEWSEWSTWNACSAGCGQGLRSRSRTCSGADCGEGVAEESESCTGPDGDCPEDFCKINIGDFEQLNSKQGCSKMYQGPDGLYVEKGGKCTNLMCGDSGDPVYKTWVCQCPKIGNPKVKTCLWKVAGTNLQDTDYGADFNSVTDCKSAFGGRSDHGEKTYRWADGRRSAAQPESEVSGGDGWELMDVCYDNRFYPHSQMRKLHEESPTDMNGEALDFMTDRKDWQTTLTYGKVVENEQGQLVCRYSSTKFPDWQEDHEIYLQLAFQTGKMQWLSSERFFQYRPGEYTKPKGMFNQHQMVTQAGDVAYGRNVEIQDWPYNLGGEPTHRFLCRVQDNREGKEQKWYNGVATHAESTWGPGFRPGSSNTESFFYRLYCTAYADDGHRMSAIAHNFFFWDEKDKPDWYKSEYFVSVQNDGSKWTKWSEWSDCPHWCGDVERNRTRQCVDKEGNEVNHEDSSDCLPKAIWSSSYSWYRPYLRELHYNTNTADCEDDDVLALMCPRWGWWRDWSECSVTCGKGTMTRSRPCLCNGDICDEIDHPLARPGLCDDLGEGGATETAECFQGSCDGGGMATGDGVGLGCKSDTHAMTPSNPDGFLCWDSAETMKKNKWSTYENEYGFVPHDYSCFAEYSTCATKFGYPEQKITKDNPATCNCDKGVCEWTGVARQDCTRGYEFIRVPMKDLDNHPFADKVVDFENPQSTERAKSAIAATALVGSAWEIHRRISDVLPVTDSIDTGDDTKATWVMTSECESGSLEWIEGPFDCSPYPCKSREGSGWDCRHSGWECQGEPRLYPVLNADNELDDAHADWKGAQRSAMVFAICRFKDENDKWQIGELIQFAEWHYSYHSFRPGYKYTQTDFQCCPAGGTHANGAEGCKRGWWGPEGGTYDDRPYQLLYSGNCKTSDMKQWSEWSEWSACSKNCENGEATGTRKKTRTCVGGEVGDLGCNDSKITEVVEPCGMSDRCDRAACTLDMNFVDFNRFRLSHTSGVKDSQYWQENGVYTNRQDDLFADPRDWSGFFPEGSMVASYRCFNPNGNIASNQEHDATCVCVDGVCDWDREMPSCTQHGANHPGYSWLMDNGAAEGSICVAANTGNVGTVVNNECVMTMGIEPGSFYDKDDATSRHNFWFTTSFFKDNVEANALFKQMYPNYNSYDGDEAQSSPDFYALSSTCDEAFEWVSEEDFSNSTSVHTPTTWQFTRFEWAHAYQHQTEHICKVVYGYGDKECYGRWDGTSCSGVNSGEYKQVKILQLSSSCEAPEAWSDCEGDAGTNCGPGTQTRGEETRSCRGTCYEAPLTSYTTNSAFACNAPSYPIKCDNCYDHRQSHVDQYGSIVYAPYPISDSRFNFTDMKLECNGGGYWAVDYLNGDNYYAPGPGERCVWKCADNNLYIPTAWNNGVMSCNYAGFIYDGSDNGWYQYSLNPPNAKCRPNYCVFPGAGMWAVAGKKQEGTRTTQSLVCEGNKWVDNGDHLLVPKDVKCHLTCEAENGKAYRTDSSLTKIKCANVIAYTKFEDFGCTGDYCVKDFIADPWNLLASSSEWADTGEFRRQIMNDDNRYIDLNEFKDDKKAGKCFRVDMETCPEEIPFEADDVQDKVIWDCPNGKGPGAVCTKSCDTGAVPNSKGKSKFCHCTKNCSWKGSVAACTPGLCPKPDGADWPGSTVCTAPDGTVIPNAYTSKFPEGTVCADPCDKEDYDYETWQYDSTTCQCNHDTARCTFSNNKLNSCDPMVCDKSIHWEEFSYGFDEPNVKLEYFDQELECDDVVPEDNPDPALAGKVRKGTNCYVKCKEGYEFKDEELKGQTRFAVKCIESWYYGMTWDVFDGAWDKYGDCDGDYGYNCGDYPQCGPK